MRILITGGCGFIGSNFINYMMKKYNHEIINCDVLTYAGRKENVAKFLNDKRHQLEILNICDVENMDNLFKYYQFDGVIHFAAESHVDRSIVDSQIFIKTNVLGTHTLLECAKKYGVKRFLQISTDEVYGFLNESDPAFTEKNYLKPSSPYSSSKTAADLLALSYHHTHGLDIVVTRCSNNYGPYQCPEKLIPLMITNAIKGEELPVYGNGKNIRDWIHVEDHCRGIDTVFNHGKTGEIYNLGGNCEMRNIDIVKKIIKYLGKGKIKFVEDRKGHDWRYAIDYSKAKNELEWEPQISFEKGIKDTIDWYQKNEIWWKTA